MIGVNSLVVILLAMAVGGVVGFEVGQHVARKQFSAMIQRLKDDLLQQAEIQKAEREKRMGEIQESAKKIGEVFRKIQETATKEKEEQEKPKKITRAKEQKNNGV